MTNYYRQTVTLNKEKTYNKAEVQYITMYPHFLVYFQYMDCLPQDHLMFVLNFPSIPQPPPKAEKLRVIISKCS